MSDLGPYRVLALLPVVLAPLGGCCSLAGLVCGPDRSDWVQKDYRSPEAALRTVMEALRRDDRRALFEGMSENLKVQLGVPGSFEVDLAIEKMRERVPGLHLLGTADVGEPTEVRLDPETPPLEVSYPLSIAGKTFVLAFVRQPFWEVSWVDAEGRRQRKGAFLSPRSRLSDVFWPRVTEEGAAGWVARPRAQVPEQLLGLDGGPPSVEGLEAFEVGQEWKLDDLREAVEE